MTEPLAVVAGSLPESALALLRPHARVDVLPDESVGDLDAVHRSIAGATAVVAKATIAIDASFFDSAGPSLRGVANVAVGYDNVDLTEAARRGIQVTNTPGVLTEATADLTMTLILGAARRIGESERLVRRGDPWPSTLMSMLGGDLQGKVLGVVGLGAIGAATARRARAFGMDVVYTDHDHAHAAVQAELEARRLELDELLAVADVVTLHCPLTSATRHLIDAAALATMKPTAYLVNCARGGIVDEEALIAALRSGSIAGAALDVFEGEPHVRPGLLELENVLLTPHIGSATVETRTAMAELAARNAAAMVRGEAPLTPITTPETSIST